MPNILTQASQSGEAKNQLKSEGTKMKYNILQIYLNQVVREDLNLLGWDEASKQYLEIKAHLDLTLEGSERWEPDYIHAFYKVGAIECDDLDDAFAILNGQPVAGDYAVIRDHEHDYPMHSLSVGDILQECESGVMHMVDPCGFSIVAARA